MLEDYYVKPSTIDRVRSSWLAPQIESYLEWLQAHGYSRLVVYRRLPLLFHFAEFAKKKGCREIASCKAYIKEFVSQWLEQHGAKSKTAVAVRKHAIDAECGVRQMLQLACQELVTRNRPRRPFPLESVVPGFAEYLSSERGFAESTIRNYRRHLSEFAQYLSQTGVTSFSQLSPPVLAAFVVEHTPKMAPRTRLGLCCHLRVLLRFCHRERITSRDLSGGSVSNTGFYSAPSVTGFFHVVATSIADATFSGSATITVTTSSGRFTPTGDMQNQRGFHTATLLSTGKVLVAGGAMLASRPASLIVCYGGISTAELYDPVSGSFSTTASMAKQRIAHTATLLLTGKVLVIGGVGNIGSQCEDGNPPVESSAELYDPSSGSFTSTGSMAKARSEHTATLLANGKVLIVGGADESFVAGVKTAELYDALMGMFSSSGSVSTPRSGHTATLLANGKVLIAGGIDRTNPNSPAATSKAELYDPTTGTFTPTNNMTIARDGHTTTLLATGRVLIAGGADLPSAEIYDPATGSFSTTGDMGQARASHTATLLSNGTVLMAGGSDSTAELYDPFTGSFSPTGGMATGRTRHSATLLQNGKVLVAGSVRGRSFVASAELYK